MKFPHLSLRAVTLVLLAAAIPLSAAQPPAREALANFDRRQAVPAAPPPAPAAASGESALRAAVPGVTVQREAGRRAPKFIGSTRGFLTGPDGEGGAVPPPAVGAFPKGDAHRGVKAFVGQHRALFGHGAEALTAARVSRDKTHGNLRTTVWQQALDGIPVFEAVFKAHTTARGELVNVASGFVPDLVAAAAKGAPNRAARLATPAITAAQAVVLAARNLGDEVRAENVVVSEVADGPEKIHRLRAPLILDVSAQYVWLPLDEETLRLCWQVLLVRKATGEKSMLLVDAETGEVLLRQLLTVYLSDATYRVFTSDSPTPFSPGHSVPSSVQPPQVARSLVTTSALDLAASPNGWIDDGVNETRGNNVDAHTDTDANNSPDLPRPQGAPNRVFDFPLDLTQAPSTYREAAVTQLFYWCNFAHDRLYQLGFTEAAGNYQNNNFSRGGVGNDAILADAQDGSGTNNANFSPSADGTPGRIQMFLWTGPNPDIDGDFDAEVVLHEYCHGLTNRLVGGGVGISALQTRGMGEGWSDFYGLALLAEAGDDIHGNWARGGYSRTQLNGTFTENYYFGGRRYPYSTNLSKNPLTFKDIDPAQADPHTGIPRHPLVGNVADQVHNVGNVWCVTLWEVRANLIAKHGFAIGNELALQLVTDGLKLAPANPNFLQARDGIVQAELVRTGGANRGEVWSGFAKRGMGVGATSPASSTTAGLVENYDLPDDLAIAPSGFFTFSGPIGGPFAPASATWTLVNSGTAPLSWSAVKTQPWTTVAPPSGTLAGGASVVVTVSVNAVGATLGTGNFSDTVTFTNVTSGLAQSRTVQLAVEPVTIPIFLEDWETGTVRSAWSITGTGQHRTAVTTANGPHGGSYHLTMDSVGGDARNEATLTMNLAGRQNVRLRFWLKMFSDESNGPPTAPFLGGADFDGVAVSADGNTWYEVQPLRTPNNAWVQYTLDLDAAVAAVGLAYNAAFKIRFNHFDNSPIATDGFAFDDLEIAEVSTQRLTLAVPVAGVSETAGSATAILAVLPVPTTAITVALASSDPTEAAVPATVVVPAGSLGVPVPLTIFDDLLLDGTQSVLLTATAAGYPNGVAVLPVHDSETASLTLQIPRAVREQDGLAIGTVTLSRLADAAIVVTLLSSDPAELTVPPSVTILQGQLSATFPITIVNDRRLDPKVATTISALVANWTGAAVPVSVYDDESTSVVVSLPVLREGDGPRNGTVQIGGTLAAGVVVQLVSSDLTELTVPATMTIPAGQTSATFPATVVDDAIDDGAQPVTVTATIPALGTGTGTGSVADNDAHHFTFAPIASPQIRNASFTVTVTARDVNGAAIASYNSPVNLTGVAAGSAVPVTPATLSAWVGGQSTGNVAVGTFGTGIVLTADDGQGHTGASNSFTVTGGALHHFGWEAIASPQAQDNFFNVTVSARDLGENIVSSFTGAAALALEVPVAATLETGTGTTTFNYPLRTGWHDSRTQVIYTAAELGAAPRRLRALAIAVFSVPGQVLNAWTIRLKHTTLASYAAGAGWEGAGWTTVYQAAQTISATGWVTFLFTTPFDYDGTSNLLVDFSHNNTSFTSDGLVRATTGSSSRTMTHFTDSGFGDPLTWSGTAVPRTLAATVPDLLLTFDAPGLQVPITPASTGSFTAGVWTGPVAVPFIGTGLRLRATASGGLTGASNAFAVQAATLPGTSATILSEPFEDATLGAWWTVTGTGQFRTQVTTANTPRAGARHLTMDCVTGNARNEATLTVNLAGRTGVALSFWAKEFSDEPNGPPAIPFLGGADFDGVAISADGNTWYEVQALRTLTATYAQLTVNLDAAIAARGLSYNSAFKIRLNQFDNTAIPSDGIAFDDLLVTATPLAGLIVTLPVQVAENAGAVSGSVTLPALAATATTVALASTATARVAVPASVVVPAGQQTASFTCTVLDNALLDGNRTVGILATAPGGNPGIGTLLVVDNDTALLTVTVPASATEGATGVTGAVTLGTVPSGTIVLTLTSSDTTEATVPATVTFAPGQTIATFPITVLNDNQFDGTQSVTLTASALGWTPAGGTLLVLDNRNLTLTLPTSIAEGASGSGTVSIFGTLPAALVVALANSDPANLSAPATVTIPAGSNFVNFTVTGVDDTLRDGTRTVSLTASAATLVSAVQSVPVLDNDVDHFTFNTIATPQIANRTFAITVFALDVNNVTIASFNGAVNLTATGSAGPVPVLPSSVTFANGFFSSVIALGAPATGVRLTASGAGATGTSGVFDVTPGAFDRFAWSPVASPKTVGVPFPVTVFATDAFNNVIPTFTGTAALSCGAQLRTIGTGTVSWEYPLYTFYHDARTQVIYPAAELGGAGTINSLALTVTTVPGQVLTSWTIRLKHTALASYGASPVWESTGWTVVHQSTATVSATGLVTFPFTTPFAYDGTSNLMIDFSFNNASFTSNGTSTATAAAVVRSLAYHTDSGFGDPLTWAGTSPTPEQHLNVPNLRLGLAGGTVPMTPATTGAFVAGSWSGPVTVQQTATGVALRATSGSSSGDSNSFTILAAPPADADGDGLPDAWESAHGLNSVTALGSDGAEGDADGDGRCNLLEHAFGTDPRAADAGAPVVSVEAHPGDGQPYLIVRYRRLLAPGALAYSVEVSPDLATWSAAPDAEEILPALATDDGATEIATVRLHPALGTPDHRARYVRLRVSSAAATR